MAIHLEQNSKELILCLSVLHWQLDKVPGYGRVAGAAFLQVPGDVELKVHDHALLFFVHVGKGGGKGTQTTNLFFS